MSERFTPPIQALPDGDAEVRLVLHLPWDVVSALGQEAGRLAAQTHRPVSLDEAVSHRLRTQAMGATHTKPPQLERNQPAPTPAPSAQPAPRSPGEQARQAIDKINGSAPSPNGGQNGATHGGAGQGGSQSGTEASGPPPGATAADTPPGDRGILERPARATGPVNGTGHGPGSLNGTATEMPR
ncbi:hypothetical protein [Streptomyces sp. NBRC 110028]|uniref:hypothetical protein n=1 Tax=Streptomyces sp. NBRC 110028 TaxID=1621260 RepID=UPI0006E1C934|nr:hypothetical protein [Streptomyces sp. NBRC 110028]